ncbi:MAG TPA: tetratricopeptide repeat protein [Kofleriaceae bacterium]|nr:tetratricopeptide repeat protein [Kofleriaceae bacterium]
MSEQTLALDIYRKGNDEFVQSRYSQALVLYREAVVHWDHPAIRYNMAVCLIEMNEPLEAFEMLERALKFGEAPLGAEKLEKGKAYRKELLGQLAQLDITCTTERSGVTLDGQPLLACPGKVQRVVAPGRHVIVGRREGFIPYTQDFTAVAGATTTYDVTLSPLAAEPSKQPPPLDVVAESQPRSRLGLYVIAGGAALGVVALTYDLLAVQPARKDLTQSAQAFDDGVSAFRTRRNIDVAMFAAAGVAVGVGVYLHVKRSGDRDALVVAPSVGSHSAMVTVQWH